MLARVIGSSGGELPKIEFSKLDAEIVASIDPENCKSAGSDTWLCLTLMPAGRYFWSKYELVYRIGLEQSKLQDPAVRRDQPGSEDDTFEIVSGVINYSGDWELKISDLGDSRRWSVDIEQNFKTLESLYELFPEYASRYEIYLAMMGKKAISLQEFLKIVEQHSE